MPEIIRMFLDHVLIRSRFTYLLEENCMDEQASGGVSSMKHSPWFLKLMPLSKSSE